MGANELTVVTIKCQDRLTGAPLEGEHEVLAQDGPLVVIEYPPGTYSVTHAASGFRATASASFKLARRAMHSLAKVKGVDWNAITGTNAKECITKEAAMEIARIKAMDESFLDD